ncbi:MAG: BACON domain-containing protein [Prevotella sp.]|nr:BACON domain-containing protein [Prevotella sp.]
MSNKLNQFANKLIRRLLTVLGFSSTFAFMACYAPAMSGDIIDVEPDTIRFEGDDVEEVRVEVNSRDKWEIVSIPSYVNVSTTSGKGNDVVTLSALPNDSQMERSDIVVFQVDLDSLGTFRDTLVVIQKPTSRS